MTVFCILQERGVQGRECMGDELLAKLRFDIF